MVLPLHFGRHPKELLGVAINGGGARKVCEVLHCVQHCSTDGVSFSSPDKLRAQSSCGVRVIPLLDWLPSEVVSLICPPSCSVRNSVTLCSTLC